MLSLLVYAISNHSMPFHSRFYFTLHARKRETIAFFPDCLISTCSPTPLYLKAIKYVLSDFYSDKKVNYYLNLVKLACKNVQEGCCTITGVGIGVGMGVSKMLEVLHLSFSVMGKTLSDKLFYMGTGLF